MTNDSDWATNLSKKYHSDLAEEAQRKAKLVEKQRVLDESTANLFSALRTAVDTKVQIFNDREGREIVSFSYPSGSHSFSIKRNPPGKAKTIVIGCDKKAHTFTISVHGKTPGDIKHLTVEVQDGAGTGYLADEGKSTTPNEVAITTIESLLTI